MATDGNPLERATAVRRVATDDGATLLFNVHLSTGAAQPILFPSSIAQLPHQYANLLFEMSSVLPAGMLFAAQEAGFAVGDAARGFLFNADAAARRMIEVSSGKIPTTLLRRLTLSCQGRADAAA